MCPRMHVHGSSTSNSTSSKDSVSDRLFATQVDLTQNTHWIIPFSSTPNSDDMYAQDSIDLLIKSGINFQKHEDFGIDIHRFGELLISSGFVLLDDVKWISFHR